MDLGTVPGVLESYGGIAFEAGNNNSLLIGGLANEAEGEINRINLTRNAAGHISGFSGSASDVAAAPFIDGGIGYAPNGVLFYSTYPSNQIGQIKPGSTAPDKISTAPVGSSTGALAFVPVGYAGAGKLAITSYTDSTFCLADIIPDGNGTYDIGACGTVTTIGNGPEAFVYVPLGSALFPNPSILVAEYGTGTIAVYELDGQGNPIVSSRRLFLSGLNGVEGVAIDPTNNDFIFSTFGGDPNHGTDNHVVRVSLLVDPPILVESPEPGTLTLLGAGLVALLGIARRARAEA